MPSKSARRKAARKANKQNCASAPQPRTYHGRFGSLSSKKDDSYEKGLGLRGSSVDLAAADDLEEDTASRMADEVARMADEDKRKSMRKLHGKWKQEDEEEVLDGAALKARQWIRIKDAGLIVFGFTLHDEQIDAVWTLWAEKRDLLLLAKTGFGKSLIFQLLPFLTPVPSLVIVLMPLKLLQAEQCNLINRLPEGKRIVLKGENNHKGTQLKIAKGGYTHIFTSPEIALSKKFLDNVLNYPGFADRLSLLAIDEIHLVEEWGKKFRPLYAEIEKVRKRIPHSVLLVGMSATLTAKARQQVVQHAGLSFGYRLMQTSLDWPEIMQNHCFMDHAQASCLDLQFIFPETATKASDIQKTIIFVNRVTAIVPMMGIIQDWMKKKGYPEHASKWIRPYYSNISEWTKGIISEAFVARQEDNTECTILVATDAYGMGVDNPDVKLVIQWDIPLSFDAMIQRMGRAGRKGGESTFILFSPKWSALDQDSDEIEKRVAAMNSRAAASAKAKTSKGNKASLAKPSPLSQSIDADEDVSDSESVAESVADSVVAESEADFDLDDVDNAEADEDDDGMTPTKRKTQACRTNAQKRAKLSDEIFNYIYVARCRRLFSLEWYDDCTYAPAPDGSKKPLPSRCCNSLGCMSPQPDFMHREPFIDTSKIKYTEVDREWAACRTAALMKWRKETVEARWVAKGIAKREEMFDSFIMPTTCISALATFGGSLVSRDQVVGFLQKPEWYGMDKYADELLICLQKNRPPLQDNPSEFVLPSKADRKAALKESRASKKIKHLNDPIAALEAKRTEERDVWAAGEGKASPAAQARMKKIADKLPEKQKPRGKKDQPLGRLALNNSQSQAQYGAFKAILSDPITPDSLPAAANQTPLPSSLQSARLSSNEKKDGKKKIAARKFAANRLNAPRPSTPPPASMELDRPGNKRKVRVTTKGLENTPSKRMRRADAAE